MQSEQAQFWVVIPAAGKGERFKGEKPKQYLRLLDKTILDHTLSIFLTKDWIKGVFLALSEEDTEFARSNYFAHSKIKIVKGGDDRAQSVENALIRLQTHARGSDWVLVHDAVRPCLHDADLYRLIDAIYQEKIGGILAHPMQETLKYVEAPGKIQTLPREKAWRALTPQMFRFSLLREALKHCRQNEQCVTDEAHALEAFGFAPKIVPAYHPNPKLTLSVDEAYIQFLLQQKEREEA